MYLLINSDNTINFGDDHPIRDDLSTEGLRLVEFPDHTLYEIVGDIKPDEAYWDEENQKVIRIPFLTPVIEDLERLWRDKELKETLNKIDQYERDQRIPFEFQTAKVTEKQYIELLRYRKRLCDYPSSENFKLQIRPKLIK